MKSPVCGLLLCFFLMGCASVDPAKVEQIMYFESIDSAPQYRIISVCECYGFSGLFRMPTFESAVQEARVEAVRKGGNAVIYWYSMRAVDVPDDAFDVFGFALLLGKVTTDESSRTGTVINALSHVEFEDSEEQLVWFFQIAEITEPAIHPE